jgi:hypothetical protein
MRRGGVRVAKERAKTLMLERPPPRRAAAPLFPHRSFPATAPCARSAAARRAARQSGGHRGPGLDLHCSQAFRPPPVDRFLSRENCVSLGTFNRAFPWLGRCVSNPSPLAPANGDFDLVPDATVLHELGAPHGSISPCAAPIAQAGKRFGGRRRHSLSPQRSRSAAPTCS